MLKQFNQLSLYVLKVKVCIFSDQGWMLDYFCTPIIFKHRLKPKRNILLLTIIRLSHIEKKVSFNCLTSDTI